MRVSAKFTGFKFKKKEADYSSLFKTVTRKTTFDNLKKTTGVGEKVEKVFKEEGNGEEEEKEEEEEEEGEGEEEEYDEDEEEEEDESSLSFNSSHCII
jgi:hypothetical protein